MKHATSPPCSARSSAVGVVVRDDGHVFDHALGDAERARHRVRAIGRPGEVERRLVRDHHLVVMAVVTALDLDDPFPPGDAAGQPDRVVRGLGARVGRAPHRQPVAGGEQLAHLGVELARRDVQRAVVELLARRRAARPGSCGRRTERRSPCRSRRTRCRRRRPSATPAACFTTTGHGSYAWKLEGTPAGITFLARSVAVCERFVRSEYTAISRGGDLLGPGNEVVVGRGHGYRCFL